MIIVRTTSGTDEKQILNKLVNIFSTDNRISVEIVDPKPISNQTCRLCKKKDTCYPYKFFGYILSTDPKFVDSPDHDDFYLHLGELCKRHEFIEGQEG